MVSICDEIKSWLTKLNKSQWREYFVDDRNWFNCNCDGWKNKPRWIWRTSNCEPYSMCESRVRISKWQFSIWKEQINNNMQWQCWTRIVQDVVVAASSAHGDDKQTRSVDCLTLRCSSSFVKTTTTIANRQRIQRRRARQRWHYWQRLSFDQLTIDFTLNNVDSKVNSFFWFCCVCFFRDPTNTFFINAQTHSRHVVFNHNNHLNDDKDFWQKVSVRAQNQLTYCCFHQRFFLRVCKLFQLKPNKTKSWSSTRY